MIKVLIIALHLKHFVHTDKGLFWLIFLFGNRKMHDGRKTFIHVIA